MIVAWEIERNKKLFIEEASIALHAVPLERMESVGLLERCAVASISLSEFSCSINTLPRSAGA